MSVTGYEAFGLYQAIKLHFTTDSYDFIKYGGKSKISVEAFENRKDKYQFYKLSRRLQSKDELIDFLVANFVTNDTIWVGDLLEDQSEAVYRQRQKVIQSLTYTFQNDCDKIFGGVDNPNQVLQSEDGDYPKLLTMTLRKEIELETLCILNKLLGFLPMWDKKITDTIRYPQFSRKIRKYTPFIQFNQDKFKTILKSATLRQQHTI
jgi:hypothetical protein